MSSATPSSTASVTIETRRYRYVARVASDRFHDGASAAGGLTGAAGRASVAVDTSVIVCLPGRWWRTPGRGRERRPGYRRGYAPVASGRITESIIRSTN